MERHINSEINKKLLIYFGLTLGITWGSWIPTLTIAYANNYFVAQIGSINLIFQQGFKDGLHILIYFINQLGVYGPFLAALITLYVFEGMNGIKNLFKQIGKWKINPIWYLIILALPILLTLANLGISALLGADLKAAFNFSVGIPILLLIFLENLITSGLEEPGWRGFALPQLHNRYSAYNSSIILGIVWAIWHYPVVYYNNLDTGPFLAMLAIIGFTALITFGSVIYSWIYFNTRSLLLLIIFHALQNFVPYLVMNGVEDPLGGFTTAIVTLVLVFIIVKKYGEETLTGLIETKK
ncbi:MAG: CPBP family intramembrane metalloprotease [Candidatus Lokiarchaeota archaeon]|nr:CPBP family intramembrane metalloprotease [Candidatus Lokiarchaeota archaeon]